MLAQRYHISKVHADRRYRNIQAREHLATVPSADTYVLRDEGGRDHKPPRLLQEDTYPCGQTRTLSKAPRA
jgi:hypothetical protein